MIDISQLISSIDGIIRWLRLLAERRGARQAAQKEALLAVYIAANESKSYVTGLKQRKRPDTEREARLARLWSEAAVALRRTDHELADKCLLLGDSLAGAMAWNDEQIDQARVAIREVFEGARRLL